MSVLTILGNIVGVLPLVQTIISGVESLFGSGNGATKLQAATSASIAALEAYSQLTGKTLPSTMVADIQAAINANVQVMNDLGLLLPHTSAATSAAGGSAPKAS